MTTNPFASVFKKAFENDILKTALYVPNPEARPKHEPRVRHFLNALNVFLRSADLAPIMYQAYRFDEAKLLDYALFLRGYMRDSQQILTNLTPQNACDSNLIKLFEASSEYAVACNHQFGNKKIFEDKADYRLWKIYFHDTLENSICQPATKPDRTRHNMFLFMPFRVRENEADVRRWVFTNMQNSLDGSDFLGRNVDLYVNFYPLEKSRAASVTSLLKTLRDPENYTEDADRIFVRNYWADFIGKDLKFDAKGNLISGMPYSANTFKQNMASVSIFSYCSGTANAHRCLNAVYQTASKLYDDQTVREAMAQIGVMSYGFLPIQQKSLYSGIHFYSNSVNDQNHREPFVNLNNHTLYEQTKCTDPQMPARYSLMPDQRNIIVALNLPERVTFWQNKQTVSFFDKENGHSILLLTRPRVNDSENYANHTFSTTFERFCLGKRGKDLLAPTQKQSANNNLLQAALTGRINRLSLTR